MGYKVLFSFAILAAVIALGSSCLDCDCLQCQTNSGALPTLPTLPNLPNPVMTLQQLLNQVRTKNRQLLRGLYNTKSNVLNTGLGVANSALDTAYNTKQQALNLAMNPLSGEGVLASAKSGAADLVSNTLQTKSNLINSLLPRPNGLPLPCDCSNCIQKDSPAPRRPCKKPMPKLYLPRPTFTYVINATSLPQFQSNPKPRKQLVKTVETVRTYVQQDPSEDEDCEYDTENIQYEFIDDDQTKDNVNIQFIKPPTYNKLVIPSKDEPVDIEDPEEEIEDPVEDDSYFEKDDIDSETLDEEIDINIDDETEETLLDMDVDEPSSKVVKRISKTKKDQDYEYCDCEDDEDYDIAIRVIRPKNIKGRKCKCKKNRKY